MQTTVQLKLSSYLLLSLKFSEKGEDHDVFLLYDINKTNYFFDCHFKWRWNTMWVRDVYIEIKSIFKWNKNINGWELPFKWYSSPRIKLFDFPTIERVLQNKIQDCKF